MSSQQGSSQQHADNSQREDRPTLPSIRIVFGAELAQPVNPSRARSQGRPSPSPHMHPSGLPAPDDASRPRSQAGASTQQPQYAYPVYPHGGSPAAHGRTATEATHRLPQHPAYAAPYGHHPAMPFHIDPSALATSGYPYAVSQPQYNTQQPAAGPSSGAGRGAQDASAVTANGRYECSWCGKSFTRPSSLKIHLNTHTGERPYVCPFEGCGRSFSVQSNMRRHARVHTRATDAQAAQDAEEDEDEGESIPVSRSASHSRGNSGSSANHSQSSSRE